jgi:hypothetical protein
MIGGRNIDPTGGAPARLSLTSGGRRLHSFAVAPGFFLERITLPARSLAGEAPYLPVEVTATPSTASAIQVSLEQFDLQADAVPMIGALEGWHEPEYNPVTGLAWRWMSDNATLWVRSAGRDVTLRLTAESPLRYFDSPPALEVAVAGQAIAQLAPSADFTWEVKIPAALLAAGNDTVTIQSDRSFVPGGGDRRNLALRVYSFEVK